MCHLLKLWLGFLPRISSFIWRYTTSSWTRSCWILVCNWEVPMGPMPCAYVESCTMALWGPWRSICRPCEHHQWLGCIGSISREFFHVFIQLARSCMKFSWSAMGTNYVPFHILMEDRVGVPDVVRLCTSKSHRNGIGCAKCTAKQWLGWNPFVNSNGFTIIKGAIVKLVTQKLGWSFKIPQLGLRIGVGEMKIDVHCAHGCWPRCNQRFKRFERLRFHYIQSWGLLDLGMIVNATRPLESRAFGWLGPARICFGKNP